MAATDATQLWALWEQQRYDEALNFSDEAIKRNPNSKLIWANRMTLFLVWERSEQALQACERALALDPGAAPPHLAKGHVR